MQRNDSPRLRKIPPVSTARVITREKGQQTEEIWDGRYAGGSLSPARLPRTYGAAVSAVGAGGTLRGVLRMMRVTGRNAIRRVGSLRIAFRPSSKPP